MSDFPKHYDPASNETIAQNLWDKQKISLPKDGKTGDTFYIPIPPPNVTGNLHLGHALTLTIEDIMVRYHRMRGDSTLWVPGTDHAGIATQAQVEKRLNSQGIDRKALGREKFLEACWEWIDEYGGNIQSQIKRMGASVNWDMERFTFDNKNNKLVQDIFIDLYNKGIIYRGEYMVNYSPQIESVISDIEVKYEEVDEKMYYINYFVSGSDKEILVATTRPETLLADQAVAVHPKDKRYRKLIGRSVILPIVNKEIPIIGDDMVDMDFGTGAVKITPAHDPTDFETAKRHNLRMDYRAIDQNGYMTEDAGPFAGQHAVSEARSNIVELLKSKGNLIKIEPYTHKVGFCSRSNGRIESVVSTQWFVKAGVLAEKVIAGYKNKDFVILPERFNKSFEDWIYNLRDWCISRQLWWGHQIPAYYDRTTGELLGVTDDPSDLFKKYGKDAVVRDQDVLDTWFSSALWPFAVLDWDFDTPSELFQKFYPANVLETGYDILFFWVIRMLLMGYEYTGETPFKTIYLHGLVLDEHGKKMSKSWGNVTDPITVVDQYSTDGLRLALTLGNTPGNNLNFSIKTVEEYSLFLNKFWNIIRFAWMNVDTITESREQIIKTIQSDQSSLLPYESWILSRLAMITEKVTQSMETYQFSMAGGELIAFIRDEFADFAIEAYKVEKDRSVLGKSVISLCVLDILTLLHPYIPHITEILYGHITGGKLLATNDWCTVETIRDINAEKNTELIWDIVHTIRNMRAEGGVKPGDFKKTVFKTESRKHIRNIKNNTQLLKGLVRISDLEINTELVDTRDYIYGISHDIEIYLHNEIDQAGIQAEKDKINQLIEDKKAYIRALESKLSNNAFIKNAPEKIIRAEMEKKNLACEQLQKLEEKLEKM